ncbi:MAG: hypothetical protein WC340_13410 [Kiritimatiellia bacterium]
MKTAVISTTNPGSTFQQNLMVACAGPDGTRRTILNHELTIRRGVRIIEQRELVTPAELLEVLALHFELYFPAGTHFGKHDSPWPS